MQEDGTYRYAHSFDGMYYNFYSGDVRFQLFPNKDCSIAGKQFSCGPTCNMTRTDEQDALSRFARGVAVTSQSELASSCEVRIESAKTIRDTLQRYHGNLTINERGESEPVSLALYQSRARRRSIYDAGRIKIEVGGTLGPSIRLFFVYAESKWTNGLLLTADVRVPAH